MRIKGGSNLAQEDQRRAVTSEGLHFIKHPFNLSSRTSGQQMNETHHP